MAPTKRDYQAFAEAYQAQKQESSRREWDTSAHPADQRWKFNYEACSDQELENFLLARSRESAPSNRVACIAELRRLDLVATFPFFGQTGLPIELRSRIYRELIRGPKTATNMQLVCRQMRLEVLDTIWAESPLRLEIEIQARGRSLLRIYYLAHWYLLDLQRERSALSTLVGRAGVLKRAKRCVINVKCYRSVDKAIVCGDTDSALFMYGLISTLAAGTCNSVEVRAKSEDLTSRSLDFDRVLESLSILDQKTEILLHGVDPAVEANFLSMERPRASMLVIWLRFKEDVFEVIRGGMEQGHGEAEALRRRIAAVEKSEIQPATSEVLGYCAESMEWIRYLMGRFSKQGLWSGVERESDDCMGPSSMFE